ncbi:MAG: LytTR family DNA-binding domain-containing protein [Ginsengibacter sp.]
MIQAIIIDDERHCIDRLATLLAAENTPVEIIGTAQTVEEGIRLINSLDPGLIFLDVQIGDSTGFDLLKALPRRGFEIIFTTAYENYAIQAIKFSAIDYLLKPIDKEDLKIALNKLSDGISKKMTSARLNILLHDLERRNDEMKRIIVPTVTGFEILNVSDIIRCESDINYTTLFLREKKKLLVAKTLKEFEELLGEYNFFRVHNSHLINLACIKSYHKGKGGSVMLTDGSEIEVSTRRRDEFLKKLAGV